MRRLKEVLLMVHGRENDVGPRPSPSPASFSSTGQGRMPQGSCSCGPAEQLKDRKRKEETSLVPSTSRGNSAER